jgi:hypothetical protein
MRELSSFDVKLKAAFRRAVDQAGGGVAVANVTRMDAGRISRYGNPNDPLMPPADIVLEVDKLAAEPICLRAMAEEWKMELVAFDDPKRSDSEIIGTVAELAETSGALESYTLRSMADGRWSPNDRKGLRSHLEAHKDSIRQLEPFADQPATLKAVS